MAIYSQQIYACVYQVRIVYVKCMHMHLHCICVLPICVCMCVLPIHVVAITQTQQALLQNVIKHLQRTQQGQWLSSEGAAQHGLCP